ncbi:MAG: tetratricopeptide repeat protein [Nitrospirae bacterium]|nr:tetratricopeptide repeat protein [Nitrospirota bacterium]
MAVDRSTLIQNAQRFMARGQIDKAIEEWQKLVSLTPQDGNLYNTIGDLYLKKNDTLHAVETFLLAASAFERAGFALKTIAVYKKILKVDPSNLDVNLKLADLNADRGLTGNAIEDYLKVAKEYGRAGKVHEALDIYRKIANFDPGNTNIRLKLAELSLREKLTTEAIDEYMKVAQIYEQNGRSTDAAGIYKKILEIDPKHAAAREALKGTVTPASPSLPTVAEVEQAITAEDWDLAGQKAGALLVHEPTNLTLRRLRGTILLHKGEAAASWADYRAVVDEAIRAQRTDEAIQLLQEYVGLAPQQREAFESLAALLEECRRIPAAVQALAALIDLMERDGVHESEVKECFQRMKALDPDGEITDRYRARFEPPAAAVGQEEPKADQAAAAPLESAPISDFEVGTGAVQTGAESFQAADPEMAADDVVVPTPLMAEQPARADLAASAPAEPASKAESSKSGRSASAPSRSASVSRRAEIERKDVSISISRQADASQSRSRDQSAPSQAKPAKRIRPRDLPDYFAEAEVYLKYGLAAKAIEQYQLIISIDANNIEGHSKLRELYQLEGRLEEAVTHSLALVRLYLSRGQRDDAEQIWAEAQEWSPDDPRVQGSLLDQAGAEPPPQSRPMPAPQPEPEIIQRPKQDLQEWLAEAEFYLQQGLQEQAHELFETIRHHYPDAPEAKAYFAAQPPSAKAGRPGVGKGLNDLVNEEEPSIGGDPSGHDDATLSKQLAELFPGAFRGMDDGLQPASPDRPPDRLTASVEGVIRAVEQGGQPLPPDGPDPHYSLGVAYKEMGLYAEARKEFEQAAALPAYHVDVTLMVAACHEAEGQPRLAVRQLQQGLEALTPDDPRWAEVACESARLSAGIGESDKAVALLQSVIRADPAHERAAALLKTLQQSSLSQSGRDAHKEKARQPKLAKPVAGERADPPPEPSARGDESKPDKNKRHRISYV